MDKQEEIASYQTSEIGGETNSILVVTPTAQQTSISICHAGLRLFVRQKNQ